MLKRRSKLILSSCRQRTVHETRNLEQEPSKSDAHKVLRMRRIIDERERANQLARDVADGPVYVYKLCSCIWHPRGLG